MAVETVTHFLNYVIAFDILEADFASQTTILHYRYNSEFPTSHMEKNCHYSGWVDGQACESIE